MKPCSTFKKLGPEQCWSFKNPTATRKLKLKDSFTHQDSHLTRPEEPGEQAGDRQAHFAEKKVQVGRNTSEMSHEVKHSKKETVYQ